MLDTIWRVGGAEDRGGISFGGIMDFAVDSSGRILVLDHVNVTVHVLDRAGKPIGTIGKKGAGPGEFRTPYRVAVAPDGMIYVLDGYDARLSEYDRNLKFLRSFLLQPMLTVRSIRVTEDAILVAGIERLSRSANETLHEFSRADGMRRRSWGELLPARTPEQAREVGAGVFAVGADGIVWYVSPGPYRIEGFDRSRRQVALYERPNDFLPPAEEVSLGVFLAAGCRWAITRRHFSQKPTSRAVAHSGLLSSCSEGTESSMSTL